MSFKTKLKGVKNLSVKSSKRSVITAWKVDADEWYPEAMVLFATNKTGTSKITVKFTKNGKSYKYVSTVKVVKYKSPIASVKLGNKNLTSKFKKETFYGKYKTNAKKEKITVKAKKGWKLKKITYGYFDPEKDTHVDKTYKNKKNISYADV